MSIGLGLLLVPGAQQPESSAAVAPPSEPAAPTLSGAVDGAVIAWAAAPSDNGAPISLYGWEVAPSAAPHAPVASGSQTDRAATAVGPLDAGVYVARTRALNAGGWSRWSADSAPAAVGPAANRAMWNGAAADWDGAPAHWGEAA